MSQTKRYEVGKLGFNAGGWVGYQIWSHVAAGLDLRFSRATASFTVLRRKVVSVMGSL